MRHQISRGLIPTVGLLLIACGSSASDGGTGTQDGAASSDVVTPSDTGGASDGGATDTAGRGTDGVLPSDAPEPDAVNDDTPDMVGPAACVPVAGDPGLVRLRGTVFTGEALIPDGEVFISRSSQSILCVGVDCSTHPDAAGATVLCTDGVITPGIIDPHNHVQYDHLPRWKHTQLFKDRYEWQVDNGYKAFKAPQVETDGKAGCEAMKHGELRLLVGGTTSVQGTKNPGACINILVRDIDSSASASGLPGAPIKDSIPKIANLSAADAKAIAENLAGGKIRAFVAHIAEGVNEAALAEWTALKDKGLAVAGTSLIHANGLDGAALAEAAAAGVDLIWSPQSNLDLYGQTALIPTAVNLGMNIAIGPDWTLSGSMTPIEELKCARQLSQKRYGGLLTDEQLVQMVTINAARSLGLDDLIGRLASGLLADVAVFAGDRSKPFDAVISSRPETVRLVFVAGQALYGDQDLMTQVGDGDCEDYSACGVAKRLCLVESGPGAVEKSDQKLANVQATLQGVLDGAKANSTCAATAEGCYAYLLNPLHKCGADADALVQCDPKGAGTVEPSADDTDGDGKPNASDNCPTVFNVDQGDQDADAAGDACDPCPTQANSTACNKPSPADLDGDGLPNTADNCPTKFNLDQADKDTDGIGDACDACPLANPGGSPCEADVHDVAKLDGPYGYGANISLKGLRVTAVKLPSSGSSAMVWVQTDPGTPWGAIALVYAGKTVPAVSPGMMVDVVGKLDDAYGLRVLSNPSVSQVGGTDMKMPDPLVVDAGTLVAAPDALPYRSLLVSVVGVAVTSENPDVPSDYGEFMVTGNLRVDDLLFALKPALGTAYASLTGVMYHASTQEKLAPRSAADAVAKQ